MWIMVSAGNVVIYGESREQAEESLRDGDMYWMKVELQSVEARQKCMQMRGRQMKMKGEAART